MVDMNVIVLDGVGLYIALAIVLLMMIFSTALACAGLSDDKKLAELQAALDAEREKNTELQVAYGQLSIKYKIKFNQLKCDGDD